MVSSIQQLDPQTKAKVLVAQYVNDHRTHDEELTLKEVHIVWFSKTLHNWKAILTTSIPDNRIYEVTYNGSAKVCYIDVYEKKDNVVAAD